PRIEGLVVLKDDDGLLDGIERRSALAERQPSCSECVMHTAQVSFYHVVGNRPGAAVNYKDWIRWHKCPFRKNAKNSLALTFSSAGILPAVLRASCPQRGDEQGRPDCSRVGGVSV